MTEIAKEVYEKILDEMSPPDGKAVSTASLFQKIDEDSDTISDAINELLQFGELEFINTNGSNMHARVRLHRLPENQNSQMSIENVARHYWLAYIVDGNDSRSIRARRLFTEREDAEKHLEAIGSATDLSPVPTLTDVWYEYLGDWKNEYAVLRKEPIFSQFDHPWE